MEYDELLKASEKLLFSSEFKELEAALEFSEPNIWQILGISRKEILITQFLAWLLDPQSQHSFGSRFLRNLIIEAIKTDKGNQIDVSPVQILVMDLSDTEIKTEYELDKRRCDIVITAKSKGFLCIIENKIGARESKEQTNYYYEHSFQKFPIEEYPKRVYIYLSPDGTPPQSEQFISLPYQAVLNGIRELQIDRRVTETERFLLRQFQESLRRSVAMDQKTRDLAQEIYKAYGPIIDFIYENTEAPDPNATDVNWDGKSWFFNVGDVGATPYSWDDCRKYSFICAGGAKRYRQLIQNFKHGNIIYAYSSGSGYVGIGIVIKPATPFQEATLIDGITKLADLHRAGELQGVYNSSYDNDICDWIVLVEWERSVEKSQAARMKPIVPSTASKIYDHRKPLVDQVRQNLGLEV
ncbi:MAG: PD-(D/E)XK nuclease family protein [Anaerolineales bacterium]|nr:PD-(D/E)XK nuclease family protein [Anaerolineales bacterium]